MVVANSGDDDAGFVGAALEAHGFTLERVHREDLSDLPRLSGTSVVVSLGSGWSTYWPHVAEAVAKEQAFLADAIARGGSVLGICFGAQQLATVLGGRVERSSQPEVGWCDIRSTPATGTTPPFLTSGPWLQWHYDRFSVPPGGHMWAESPVGPQVFTHGRSLGVQFHPEATESIVRGWSEGEGDAELRALGMVPADLLDETRSHVTHSRGRCEALVEWFLVEVAQLHLPE